MPCTLKGYPEKWKEFETLKREKAIEIANAMLREGYLEKDVIPIATKKSKRLVSNAIERRNQSIRRRKHRTIPYSNNGKNRGG